MVTLTEMITFTLTIGVEAFRGDISVALLGKEIPHEFGQACAILAVLKVLALIAFWSQCRLGSSSPGFSASGSG